MSKLLVREQLLHHPQEWLCPATGLDHEPVTEQEQDGGRNPARPIAPRQGCLGPSE